MKWMACRIQFIMKTGQRISLKLESIILPYRERGGRVREGERGREGVSSLEMFPGITKIERY